MLGSGAREHAIVAALANEQPAHELICAPGNPGIEQLATTLRLDVNNPRLVADFAEEEGVDLVVVGPEAPLVSGVADELRRRRIRVFGPSSSAARIEGSKIFAKQVMDSAGVPSAVSHLCTEIDEVERALDYLGAPYVVKADGLASGKGVIVTDDRHAALVHADAWLPAGPVLVEEFLDGVEVSQFVFTDGKTVRATPPAQDFKRLEDGGQGPNTGGMGAYSPVPFLNQRFGSEAEFSAYVVEHIASPVISQLRRMGEPFQGLLYCGLMLTRDGLRVIEFNARFGDPETQVVLPRLNVPLSSLLLACTDGTLDELPDPLPVTDDSIVTVVLASPGYPQAPETGQIIYGLSDAVEHEGVSIMHAATGNAGEGSSLRATGGRVLNVVASGDSLEQARERAYEAMSDLHLEGGQFRRDIAEVAVAGQKQGRHLHPDDTVTAMLPQVDETESATEAPQPSDGTPGNGSTVAPHSE